MLKMKFWFEGNQLQPDCNIHGGCKIGSSACHACPHCVRVNSKDQEVLCLGDGSEYKEVKLEELRVGDRFKTVKNVYGNQSVLYQKILEAEIPVMCSYLGVLETARREALADERYEDVQRLIDTIRYNTGTLEQLRREYSMMRKDSQSTR